MPTPTRYPAWNAPRVEPLAVELANAFLKRDLRFAVPLGEGSAQVAVQLGAAPFVPQMAIEASVGQQHWLLEFSSTEFLALHPVLHASRGTYPDEKALPQELRAAAAELLLAPVLERLAGAIGVPCASGDIAFPHDSAASGAAAALTLTVSAEDSPPFLVTALAQSEGAALELAQLVQRLPARGAGVLAQAAGSIPFAVAVEAARTTLSQADIAGLALGDVLVASGWMAAPTLTLYSGARPLASAPLQVEGGTATALQDPAAIPETPMTDSMTDTKSLEVEITFELDRKTVTLAELTTIRAGYTFELAGQAPVVTVRANGKALAHGRLVDINGTPGVEITEPA